MKSFRPKDGSGEPPTPGRSGERDFHGETRTGQPSQLCHMAHVLMENRSGLVVDTATTAATGTAEREAAVAMAGDLPAGQRITLRTDKAYDTRDFVAAMRRPGRDSACLAEHQTAPLRHRWPYHAPCPPRGQPAYPQAHRGGVRLDQDGRWPAQDPSSRHVSGRLDVHLRGGRYNLVRIPKLLAGAA